MKLSHQLLFCLSLFYNTVPMNNEKRWTSYSHTKPVKQKQPWQENAKKIVVKINEKPKQSKNRKTELKIFYAGVLTPEKKGEIHTMNFNQDSAPFDDVDDYADLGIPGAGTMIPKTIIQTEDPFTGVIVPGTVMQTERPRSQRVNISSRGAQISGGNDGNGYLAQGALQNPYRKVNESRQESIIKSAINSESTRAGVLISEKKRKASAINSHPKKAFIHAGSENNETSFSGMMVPQTIAQTEGSQSQLNIVPLTEEIVLEATKLVKESQLQNIDTLSQGTSIPSTIGDEIENEFLANLLKDGSLSDLFPELFLVLPKVDSASE